MIAGIAQRLLVATIDGERCASQVGGRFHAEVHAGATVIEIVLAIDADGAKLALGARDPAGQRWRDGWLLELVRGEDRWFLEPGGMIEIADARRGPIVAQLRVRRRWLIGERTEDNVQLADVSFHRYTRQSTVIERDANTAASEPVPWMTPTRAEAAPWWEIDLGKPMCIAWMRIDLDAMSPETRITCAAFGHPAPSGGPPAGSIVRELRGDELHDVDGQSWFTVDEAVVARYVRVQAYAPAGEATAIAITAAEIQAAELHGETLAHTLRRAFVLHADRALCLARSTDPDGGYVPTATYREVWARATAISRGLAAHFEPAAERVVVGVMTRNRPEWLAIDLAIVERGYVSIALAPDDADDRLAQIFALAKPTCVVVEAHNAPRVARLAPAAKLIVLDGAVDGALDFATLDGPPVPPAVRGDDDLYAVLFTSGSTGTPKGAMRSYKTFAAMLASYEIGHSPRHLSFQPLSHLSERMYTPAILINGGCIAYSQGGAHLIDELAALEPTTVGSVPRLWEVLHAGYARRVRGSTNPGADEPRILAETRALLGTRLLAVSVGSAPCSAEVLAFLRRCFADVWVSEGYGTTELGTIAVDGVIAKGVAVKLVNGEIWVKSPHVIEGYLGDARATVDDDGYVATGDLGERDAQGRVRIIGRARNTIKLAQGEFVAIDRVEAMLATAPGVDRIFVHAGYGASHLAAVVVPDPDAAPGVDVVAALRAHARAVGLAAYETPSEVIVETEPFSVENGLLTASGKLARAALVAKYGGRVSAVIRPAFAALAHDDLATRIARIASEIAKRTIAVDEPLGAGVGVDSLAAAEILAALSEALDRDVPLGWWFESRTIGDLAARLGSSAHGDAANLALARADLALATPQLTAARPVRRVLLTGATGFLGAFLVEALRAVGLEVACLVRARDAAHAQQRLDEALARRRITARATAIAGDLAAIDPELDLDVDAIVHAGATVSWLASYEALRGPNVHGTLALLALAARRGLAFHHVSTISTAPPDGDEDAALTFEQAVASTPYALSKWIAEAHARRAGQAAIYRPAMIAADTVRGIGNPDDYLNRYIDGVRELGVFIDRDDAIIDMTPVDFVARAIAACVVRGEPQTMHLANVDQSMTYAALGRALVAAGVPAAPASYEAFRAALLANKTSRLHPLAAFFPEQFALGMGPWPCARSVARLAALGVERPRIDAALIARYVSARDERH